MEVVEEEEAHQSWAAEAEVLRWAEAEAAVVVDNPWCSVVGVVRVKCVGDGKARVTGGCGCEYQVTVLVCWLRRWKRPNFRAIALRGSKVSAAAGTRG